ncbi:DUF6415 family natural product biosynthesis protein [Streptomyces sp. NPDC015127]|uniref:DUF6415 family natural product biosynthesis protein n=1 Tax=Streptomyces sp. NPDC015127 TaxID=3364939 RepID=UPI0036FEE4A4
MKHHKAPQTADSDQGDSRPVDLVTIRNTARRVLALGGAPPLIEDLDKLIGALRGYVQLLVPEIRALIRTAPAGDIPAAVAQVGIDEAWRRLNTGRGFGPDADYRHAKKVALSVRSLCDHYENLNPRAR